MQLNSIEKYLNVGKLLESPPNFEMAQNHNKAQIIYKEIIRNSERCPCCNQFIQTIKYPLSTDINVFSEYGTSYKYFNLVKIKFILLSIFFIIAGLYNLIQSSKGDLCIKSQTCKKSLNNYLSLLNRFDPENYQDDVLDTLYTIAIIVQLVFIRYISYNINDYYNVDHDYDCEKTIQKCSLKISSIHPNWSRDRIIQHFSNGMLGQNQVQYQIVDCCLIYDISHLETQLKLQIIQALKENQDRLSFNQFIAHQKILQREQDRNRYLKFSGSVYITLSYEQEAINFKNSFKLNFDVENCPRPSDVYWKVKQLKGNQTLEFIKCAIAFCGWLPNIGIQVAKNNYILSNPGKTQDQLYINTLLSLVIAIIYYISTKICIQIIQNYIRQISVNSKRQFWKEYLQANEFFINTMFYLWPPIFIAVYSGVGTRQEKLWRSGGLSEDIIMIFLTNAGLQIIFTICDVDYAWQLIRIIYYKYFNKQSNLTQYEANELFSKDLNFNKKRIDLTNLIILCSYYGYLFPICYPITLISILIIYWLDKYQFINNGINEKIKFKYRLQKFIIMMTILSQLGSTQIIKITFLGYTSSNAFTYIYYVQVIILIYIFFYKKEWIFKKRIQTPITQIELNRSLQNNELYSEYNPIINDKRWSIQEKEQQVNEIQLLLRALEQLNNQIQSKYSRQEKFYNALQIKLLREIEQIQKKERVGIAQIQPIQNDII
ncbi:unnamed protein product [Paramecium primaurelia]|uniref:CSC1/OSCA1-like cytosolic domain-containing protein n=1 Tax=Paramecium primaurelia TaxID=5886 RepID=A0A8S1M578_PARPR|nr:unnamed protein product [Paramecium primaurelia]